MTGPQSHLKRNPYGLGFIKDASPTAVVKDVDEKEGLVTGYFASFDNIDSQGDYIERGAFAKTIGDWGPSGRGRIAHLLDHNPTHRVAKIRELREDDHGLRYVSKMSETSKGRDALIEYDEGIITEHSIGFDIIGWRRDEERDAFALTELKLYEGSGVTWGANMETPTVDVKSLLEDPLIIDHMVLQMKGLKRVLRREITDERAKELEQQLQQFEQVFTELKTALYAENGPLNRTQLGDGISPEEPHGADETMLHIANELNKTLAA